MVMIDQAMSSYGKSLMAADTCPCRQLQPGESRAACDEGISTFHEALQDPVAFVRARKVRLDVQITHRGLE